MIEAAQPHRNYIGSSAVRISPSNVRSSVLRPASGNRLGICEVQRPLAYPTNPVRWQSTPAPPYWTNSVNCPNTRRSFVARAPCVRLKSGQRLAVYSPKILVVSSRRCPSPVSYWTNLSRRGTGASLLSRTPCSCWSSQRAHAVPWNIARHWYVNSNIPVRPMRIQYQCGLVIELRIEQANEFLIDSFYFWNGNCLDWWLMESIRTIYAFSFPLRWCWTIWANVTMHAVCTAVTTRRLHWT